MEQVSEQITSDSVFSAAVLVSVGLTLQSFPLG